MTTPTEVQIIPLNRLIAWDQNARKQAPHELADAELDASIAAHGLLQPPVVIACKEQDGFFEVVAGERRRQSLMRLQQAGKLDGRDGIECVVTTEDDEERLLEISLAENTVREPMHPADQFEAFQSMIDAGEHVDDIAARFGVTTTIVRGRMKLANLPEAIMTAFRNNQLTLAQAQAFAMSDDSERQIRTFEYVAKRDFDETPEDIREALSEGLVTAADRRVRYLTLQAYEDAGGPASRDLFCQDDSGIFINDVGLLDEMVEEKLKGETDALLADGWLWAEVIHDYGWTYRQDKKWTELRADDQEPLSEDALREIELLEKENAALEEIEDPTDEQVDRSNWIDDRLIDLRTQKDVWFEATKKKSGVALQIDRNGNLEMIYGIARPEDQKGAKKSEKDAKGKKSAAKAGSADNKTEDGDSTENATLSNSLIAEITAHKSTAISAVLALKADSALIAVVHCLALQTFYPDNRDLTCLRLTINPVIPKKVPKTLTEKGACKGFDAINKFRETWEKNLPEEAADLWQWCIDAEKETLEELLAFIASLSVSAIAYHFSAEFKEDDPDNQLGKLVGVDMPSWFKPTAENYYGRVGKPIVFSAMTEATGQPVAPGREKLKKADLAQLAERELAPTGWIPPQARIIGQPFMFPATAATDDKPEKAAPPAKKPAAKKKAPAKKPAAKKPASKSTKKKAA